MGSLKSLKEGFCPYWTLYLPLFSGEKMTTLLKQFVVVNETFTLLEMEPSIKNTARVKLFQKNAKSSPTASDIILSLDCATSFEAEMLT